MYASVWSEEEGGLEREREREGFAFLDLIWAGNDRSDSNKFVSLLPLLKKVLP